MSKILKSKSVWGVRFLSAALLFTACESDIAVPSVTDELATTSSRAVYSSRSINWNKIYALRKLKYLRI